MKNRNYYLFGFFLFSIGTAIGAKKKLFYTNATAYYWDPKKRTCVGASSPFSCTIGLSVICIDETTGNDLHDGFSIDNPCGVILTHD